MVFSLHTEPRSSNHESVPASWAPLDADECRLLCQWATRAADAQVVGIQTVRRLLATTHLARRSP